MFLSPGLQAGVQRVAALCRGRGVPEILFFPFPPPEAAEEKREMGHSPIPQSRGRAPCNPAKDVLRASQKFGMTHRLRGRIFDAVDHAKAEVAHSRTWLDAQ